MTGKEFHAALAAINARLVVRAKLPPGPGIFDDEVGGDGPWYGILFESGYTYGWAGNPDALMDPQVLLDYGGQGGRIVDLLASAIVRQRQAGRADGIAAAANLVRYLRPDTACTCGSYLSFHSGVPSHQPGCLVGECIDAADEIEGLLDPPNEAVEEAQYPTRISTLDEWWRCPECGPGVAGDEDGCCANCGADLEIEKNPAVPIGDDHE